MKAPRRRRPRASAEQLYRTCKVTGNCPEDVVNKFENKTWADRILQWGSLATFFGRLGIGTGAGTGGKTGYVPLATRPPTAEVPLSGPPIARPPAVPDIVVGDVGLVPSVSAGDSSIIPMVELSTPTLDVIAEAPSVNTTSFGGDGAVLTTDVGPAVIEPRPTGRLKSSTSQFHNPVYHNTHAELTTVGESSVSVGTLITHGGSQTLPSVAEEIELTTFLSTLEGEPPPTSTPVQNVVRAASFRPFARGTQQVRVSDPLFMSRPSDLITYDNPAFEDPDETIIFEHPSIHQAPDPDFMDIIALHRPALTRTRQGNVRFSRIGNRGTIRTRSGAQIGGRVHYYHDLTPIVPETSIEMEVIGAPLVEPIGSAADEETIFDVFSDVDDIPNFGETAVVQDSLTFNTDTVYNATSLPFPAHMPVQVPLAVPGNVNIFTQGPGLTIVSPPLIPASIPTAGKGGSDSGALFGGLDYYLHPGLTLRRKRKRKPVIYLYR